MPSAAGKRVGRVLAGCSKPEAGDKPCYHTWQVILGTGSLHRSPRCRHDILRFLNVANSVSGTFLRKFGYFRDLGETVILGCLGSSPWRSFLTP